jgi:2-iminobutanoate/2-iminopropanoate deaminase
MELQPISTNRAPIPRGPYNQAIRAGETIYVAGQVPVDPRTNQIVEGDAAVQARQVFENIKAILEAAGASMDRVVKTTIFLADVNDFTAVNTVYAEYFTSQPARSTVAVAALPGGGAKLQVDAIAIRG